MNRIGLLLGFCFLIFGMPVLASGKTDVVLLANGDRVTGEIVKLEAGLLEFKTDTMGTVNIEWRFIDQVYSETTQTIETVSGERWLGQLKKPQEGDSVIVNTVRGPITVQPENVVSVWPVEATFWDKLEFSTSVGFDFTKSTDITNFNLAADLLYRSDDRITSSSFRSDITSQSEGEDQNRQEFRLAREVVLPEQRFRSFEGGFDVNDALGIDLRIFGGASYGAYLKKTNNVWFSISGGLIASQERVVGADTTESLEAVGTLRYRFFRYADPERRFDTALSVYPSLTESGRVRGDLRSTFKLEFFSDLFWALEVYASYDNKPLSEDAEKSDYGITTSLGWSY